jgi:hypothetical protein
VPAPIAWTVYAHRATLASSASDGQHELRAGLRVVSEDDAAQLQSVLNESASTGSQARMTARRRGRARQKARGVQCDAAELVCANLSCVRHVGFRMHASLGTNERTNEYWVTQDTDGKGGTFLWA